jgi:hypothetical protein
MEIPPNSVDHVLLQYGAIGAVLVAILGLFLWAFHRLFSHILGQWDDFRGFMRETVKELQANREAIQSSHREIVHEIQLLVSRETATAPLTIGTRRRGE